MSCCTLTGERTHDRLVVGQESKASCAALFAAALGPYESPQHLAIEALSQMSTELTILEDSLCAGEGCEIDSTILRRVIHGLAERARAAAEVAGRIRSAAAAGKRGVTP